MHHKLLLGSTALVSAGLLFAGTSPAQAEIEVVLGGFTEFGVVLAEDDEITGSDRGYGFFMDNEVIPQVNATSDSGIEYGMKVELEVGSSRDDPTDPADAFMDEAVLFFSGAFGRFELGREDGANDVMFVGGEDVQAGTGGTDGDTANLNPVEIQHSSDAAKVTYFTPRIAGFQLGASYTPDEDDDFGDDVPPGFEQSVGFGANWTGAFAGLDMTVSGTGIFAENEDEDEDDKFDWQAGFNTAFAGLEVGAGYSARTDINEADIIVVGVGYGIGPVDTSVAWSFFDPDEGDEANLFAGSATLGILPGVETKGDITYNDDSETLSGVVTVQLNY